MKSTPNPLRRWTSVMLEKASKEQGAPIWMLSSKAIADDTKNRVEVNLSRISRVAAEGQALFVPGKVLGTGTISTKVVVGAFSFSASAKSKIEDAGGSALDVERFVKKYPKGTGVKLVE